MNEIMRVVPLSYFMFNRHDFSDKEYWLDRWFHCFPGTYPPELYCVKDFPCEHEEGFWFWKKKYTTYSPHGACLRCGERICTGHMCKDLVDYRKELGDE